MVAWVFGVSFVCRKDQSAAGKHEVLSVSYSLVRSTLPRWKKIFYFPFLEQTKGPETYNSCCFFLLLLKRSLFITDRSFCYQISVVDK